MAFKVGTGGRPMFEECSKLGVAAITYKPLAEIDLSKHSKDEEDLWRDLDFRQRASLQRVAYEMAEGDVVFVKDGPKIIDRGVITGAYSFDYARRIRAEGVPWTHQVAVDWSRQFKPKQIQLGKDQWYTVEELTLDDVSRAESSEDSDSFYAVGETETLGENGYYRESPARRKHIDRCHNKLSNQFCRWLVRKHKTQAVQESQCIDIRFILGGTKILAELKTCWGVGTTRSIREALGQLLEYNHYPSRNAADDWLIVLDEEPCEQDRVYIQTLRDKLSLPVIVGWQTTKGFSFHPKWPS